MFEIMHNFWVQCFPSWAEYFSVGYIILDILTIIVFLRIVLVEIPAFWNGGK